jgi:CRP-like cAMP-binding protein
MTKSPVTSICSDNSPQGSFFNERALLGDGACSATITAAGVVECYVINREDFERHLGRLQDIVTARSSESAESAVRPQ